MSSYLARWSLATTEFRSMFDRALEGKRTEKIAKSQRPFGIAQNLPACQAICMAQSSLSLFAAFHLVNGFSLNNYIEPRLP
jgi:hypothetical protein